jgi:hypothetical protein
MNTQLIENNDKFEYWLMDMDDALIRFVDTLPTEIKAQIDFSPESLVVLEAWLLSKYSDTDKIMLMTESKVVDGAARYVGEVFRRCLGGKWVIDFKDKNNVFYGLPQLSGLPGQTVQICPLTLVTASTDRRTGKFLYTIYLNNKKNAAK